MNNATRIQVTDPACATCHGVGATPAGALCPPCAVPIPLMSRSGAYQQTSPAATHGRALIPLTGCATCRGTGRDGQRPCLPCAVVYRP